MVVVGMEIQNKNLILSVCLFHSFTHSLTHSLASQQLNQFQETSRHQTINLVLAYCSTKQVFLKSHGPYATQNPSLSHKHARPVIYKVNVSSDRDFKTECTSSTFSAGPLSASRRQNRHKAKHPYTTDRQTKTTKSNYTTDIHDSTVSASSDTLSFQLIILG